jgi:hypothetical protein
MDRAARSMLYFGFVGLLVAGSLIAVLQTTTVIAKEGVVSVYFSSIASDIQGNPGFEVTSLSITIDSISIHRGEESGEVGWTEISNRSVTLDIMKPTDMDVLIGTGVVQEQNITMVRLHVASAVATVKDPEGNVSTRSVVVSSSELKVPLRSALVRAQLATSILLDFNPHVVTQGNDSVRLTPVLHLDRVTGPA